MGLRALEPCHIGADGIVAPGDEIPATYVDLLGVEQEVDADRLIALGAAERVDEPAKAKRSRS